MKFILKLAVHTCIVHLASYKTVIWITIYVSIKSRIILNIENLHYIYRNHNINMTLYDNLKPEIKAKLEENYKEYSTVRFIFEKLKQTNPWKDKCKTLIVHVVVLMINITNYPTHII